MAENKFTKINFIKCEHGLVREYDKVLDVRTTPHYIDNIWCANIKLHTIRGTLSSINRFGE